MFTTKVNHLIVDLENIFYEVAFIEKKKGQPKQTHTQPQIVITETVQTYGGPTDLWGTTWTDTDINGSGFGVSTIVYISRPEGAEPATNPSISTVDQVYVTIYYTGGSSGSAATILPSSFTVIGGPRNITVKSVTNIITSSIRNPTLPRPTGGRFSPAF